MIRLRCACRRERRQRSSLWLQLPFARNERSTALMQEGRVFLRVSPQGIANVYSNKAKAHFSPRFPPFHPKAWKH
jgi:hypothetical protein